MGICWSWSWSLPSQPSTINIDKLRCSNCKLLLSCGPVRLTTKGSVCGRCTVPEHGTHEVLFESMLKDVFFPCRFKNFDCKTRLRFNTVLEHEQNCPYVPFTCPLQPCNWHGAQHQTWHHFRSKHSENWARINFTIDLNKDRNGFIIQCVQGTPFLIRYDYSKTTRNLTYDLGYFSNIPITATYNIELKNNLYNEIQTSLRELPCCRFNPQKRTNHEIDLSNYLVALDNPETILLYFRIHATTFVPQPLPNNTVNFGVLESLRCNECHNYLSIPVFDSAIGRLCFDCSKNASTSRPSPDIDLEKKIIDTMFPCRWKKCSHVDSGDRIRKHELNCKYYLYVCPAVGCKVALIYKQLFLHLNVFHGMTFFHNKTSYNFFFNGTFAREFVTINSNNIIVIKHDSSNNVHTFSLRSTDSFCKVVANIYLEHSHCNLKSKTYNVHSAGIFTMNRDKLPKCFRNNEKLTLVIEV